MKQCGRCRKDKPNGDFVGVRGRIVRDCGACRDLSSKRAKEWYQRAHVKKRILAKAARDRKRLPITKDGEGHCAACKCARPSAHFVGLYGRATRTCKVCREKRMAYYSSRPQVYDDKTREYQRQYRDSHKEELSAYQQSPRVRESARLRYIERREELKLRYVEKRKHALTGARLLLTGKIED